MNPNRSPALILVSSAARGRNVRQEMESCGIRVVAIKSEPRAGLVVEMEEKWKRNGREMEEK